MQSTPPSLELLIERAKAGESRAFEALARQFLRPAYIVALAIVRRPQDAEDVAQDALILAFQKLDSCREPTRFSAWLLTIVRNQSRNFLDKRKLRDVLPEETDAGLIPATFGGEPNIQKAQLLRALSHLSEVEREVVLLHDLEGYTHEEIGDTLGISCVMSRQHLFVSRKKLRQSLGTAETDGGP